MHHAPSPSSRSSSRLHARRSTRTRKTFLSSTKSCAKSTTRALKSARWSRTASLATRASRLLTTALCQWFAPLRSVLAFTLWKGSVSQSSSPTLIGRPSSPHGSCVGNTRTVATRRSLMTPLLAKRRRICTRKRSHFSPRSSTVAPSTRRGSTLFSQQIPPPLATTSMSGRTKSHVRRLFIKLSRTPQGIPYLLTYLLYSC